MKLGNLLTLILKSVGKFWKGRTRVGTPKCYLSTSLIGLLNYAWAEQTQSSQLKMKKIWRDPSCHIRNRVCNSSPAKEKYLLKQISSLEKNNRIHIFHTMAFIMFGIEFQVTFHMKEQGNKAYSQKKRTWSRSDAEIKWMLELTDNDFKVAIIIILNKVKQHVFNKGKSQ